MDTRSAFRPPAPQPTATVPEEQPVSWKSQQQTAQVPPEPAPQKQPMDDGADANPNVDNPNFDNPNPNKTAFEESEMFPGQFKPIPEEDILLWEAPSRPFKKRNKQFYSTVATIVVLISMILFFAGQFLPIAVVISVAFLAYVLSSVPPNNVKHKVTTYGFRLEDQLYYWEEMGRFWFEDKYGQRLIKIEVARFPGQLTILLGEVNQSDLEEILMEVLIKEKPKDTFFDKSAKWLQEKIPLDNE